MTTVKIFLASLTTFFGVSAFVAFLMLKNYPCASLGLLSASTDSILLLLHILVKKRKLREWYSKSDLHYFTIMSFVMLLIGLACSIYFATVELKTKTPIMPIASSKVLPLIWSVIVARGAVLLLYFSLSYQQLYETEAESLLSRYGNETVAGISNDNPGSSAEA